MQVKIKGNSLSLLQQFPKNPIIKSYDLQYTTWVFLAWLPPLCQFVLVLKGHQGHVTTVNHHFDQVLKQQGLNV